MPFPTVRLQDHSLTDTTPTSNSNLAELPSCFGTVGTPPATAFTVSALLLSFYQAQSRNEDLNHCNLLLQWKKKHKVSQLAFTLYGNKIPSVGLHNYNHNLERQKGQSTIQDRSFLHSAVFLTMQNQFLVVPPGHQESNIPAPDGMAFDPTSQPSTCLTNVSCLLHRAACSTPLVPPYPRHKADSFCSGNRGH